MHRLLFGASLLASIVLSASGIAAASTAGTPTTILAHTSFVGDSPFDSTLAGCGHGMVFDARRHVQFDRAHNVFNGAKVFACDGGGGGFTLQLNATFGGGGSTGTWAVIDSWGSQAGLNGQGSLVGTPTQAGIDDLYTGWTSR